MFENYMCYLIFYEFKQIKKIVFTNNKRNNPSYILLNNNSSTQQNEGIISYFRFIKDRKLYYHQILEHIEENDSIFLVLRDHIGFFEDTIDYICLFEELKHFKKFQFHVLYLYHNEISDQQIIDRIQHINIDSFHFFDEKELINYYHFIDDDLDTLINIFGGFVEDKLLSFNYFQNKDKIPFIKYHMEFSEVKYIDKMDHQNKVLKQYEMIDYFDSNLCDILRQYRNSFIAKYNLSHSIKNNNTYTKHQCNEICYACDQAALSLWHKIYHSTDVTIEDSIYLTGIRRLRNNIDGKGLRTLLITNRCHLKCAYCINKHYINSDSFSTYETCTSLNKRLQKDLLYMKESDGGITFGGGEPLLYADFIINFKHNFPNYSINVQTSLNIDQDIVDKLVNVIDEWIIDIKDMNDEIYYAYTKTHNEKVYENLKLLIDYIDIDKIICRVPHIPNYNTDFDVINSIKILKELGIKRIDEFSYQIESSEEEL